MWVKSNPYWVLKQLLEIITNRNKPNSSQVGFSIQSLLSKNRPYKREDILVLSGWLSLFIFHEFDVFVLLLFFFFPLIIVLVNKMQFGWMLLFLHSLFFWTLNKKSFMAAVLLHGLYILFSSMIIHWTSGTATLFVLITLVFALFT